jgi:hypothetical protein
MEELKKRGFNLRMEELKVWAGTMKCFLLNYFYQSQIIMHSMVQHQCYCAASMSWLYGKAANAANKLNDL